MTLCTDSDVITYSVYGTCYYIHAHQLLLYRFTASQVRSRYYYIISLSFVVINNNLNREGSSTEHINLMQVARY